VVFGYRSLEYRGLEVDWSLCLVSEITEDVEVSIEYEVH
jgi:hypothetical protein